MMKTATRGSRLPRVRHSQPQATEALIVQGILDRTRNGLDLPSPLHDEFTIWRNNRKSAAQLRLTLAPRIFSADIDVVTCRQFMYDCPCFSVCPFISGSPLLSPRSLSMSFPPSFALCVFVSLHVRDSASSSIYPSLCLSALLPASLSSLFSFSYLAVVMNRTSRRGPPIATQVVRFAPGT